MDTLTLLQHYWWLIISLLGALLVFLLFVQGGQGLLYDIGKTEEERNMLVNSLGRKWEFTFTTLVTLRRRILRLVPALLLHVVRRRVLCMDGDPAGVRHPGRGLRIPPQTGQRLRRKDIQRIPDDQRHRRPLLLGTAVGTLFTGANFTVDRLNLANGAGSGSATVISQWTTPWHGLEALTDVSNVFLGIAVTFLAATLACQYFMNNIDDKTIHERARRRMIPAAVCFVLFFVAWLGMLLFADGRAVDAAGRISIEPYKYLHNFIEMPYLAVVLLLGVVSVLWSIGLGWRGRRNAIWFGGAGTVLTVLALLLCAGWNDTAYYPSLADMQSSLTIYNSSSSLFTLKVMSIVSLLIPFVAAYIWYAWRAMNRKPITREEIRGDDHQY